MTHGARVASAWHIDCSPSPSAMSQAETLERPPLAIPPGLQRTRPRRWLIALASSVIAVIAIIAVRELRPEAASARYRTATAERRTITRTVKASGEIDVPKRHEVAALTEGRLAEIRAFSGMRVKKGDVLARLEAANQSIEVASARATERAAGARLRDAEARWATAAEKRERMQRLVGKDLIQKRHLSDAAHAEQSARGARDAARAERDMTAKKRLAAELAVSELMVRAPADGIVLSSPRAQGALVSPARGTLFTIGDTMEELRLEARVAEADIGAVAAGQSARFTVPAFTEQEFSARVERVLIEPERHEGAVFYRVVLVAENRGGRLLPGMTANVSIAIAEGRDVLAVREAALRFTPDDGQPAPPRSRVWKSPDGIRIAAVEVRPGITDGAYTEVSPAKDGSLAPGQAVVVGLIEAAAADDTGPGVRLGGR